VVRADGTLADGYAFGGKRAQKQKLINEGIKFINSETVDLKHYLFKVPLNLEIYLRVTFFR